MQIPEPVVYIIPLYSLVADFVILHGNNSFSLGKLNAILLSVKSWDSFMPNSMGKVRRHQRSLSIKRNYFDTPSQTFTFHRALINMAHSNC